MVISRTPFRISFFGGGTDYPAWYLAHGGSVLASTINKYCYLTCRYLPPFFENRFRIVYSRIELTQNADEIDHPAVRGVLKHLGVSRGLEIHHDGDLPARSGLGSSSAFTVGLLHAILALQGNMRSKSELAKESIHIEQNVLKETVGSQDQVCAAYGGFNHINFHPSGEVTVQPITLSHDRLKELRSHLMLFFTGIKRTAADVAASYVNRISEKTSQLKVMRELLEDSLKVLSSGQDLGSFGELLHRSWEVKRSLSEWVSNSQVDRYYQSAREAGAIGGKLLGAGGGGFLLLFVPPDRQCGVREQLDNLLSVPFEFEFSGSQIIFFDPEEDYSEQEKDRANRRLQSFRELAPNPAADRATE